VNPTDEWTMSIVVGLSLAGAVVACSHLVYVWLGG
jgi:hypothetical protein